ncbi:MAG: hypothetical protein QGF25_04840 [Candidatus Woesearchaeota archaeon]|jgi:hypothetical protein|nr:hypothetical protein [Candidatus Woesearchaeota archaeon]MDP7467539.1 hypothetical protein [Candidatus Woesearchaeota archaeon]MDP7647021.1 hypothetical protein [Candidatus Woesearchaeota archaeon]
MRGQITIFIILGIIILTVAGVGVVVFRQDASTTEAKPRTDLVIAFVQSCLQVAGEEALHLLSDQGIIEERQGGQQSDMDDETSTILGQGRVANYILLQPEFNIPGPPLVRNAPRNPDGLQYKQLDDYPWNTFPIISLSSPTVKAFRALSVFGWANVPPTNTSFKRSVEESLESYTEERMLTCPLDALEEQGAKIVAEDAPIVDVKLTEEGTDLFLNWPLKIIDASGTTRQQNFAQHYDIRLKRLLRLIRLIVDKEITDLNFELHRQAGVKINNVPTGTVVTITDSKSRLAGKPYNMSFGVPNRAPVLLYVDQKKVGDIRACQNTRLQSTGTQRSPGKVQEKLRISGGACNPNKAIQIEAIDPDDWQPLTLRYTPDNFGGAKQGIGVVQNFNQRLTGTETGTTVPCLHLLIESTDGSRTDGQLVTLFNGDPALCIN